MRKMKKAQMEMVGLVVIVILITLGMLFMAIFYLRTDDSKKIFTRKGLSYSTMSAILKTTIVCDEGGGRVKSPQLGKEFLEDVAANHDLSQDYCSYQCKYNGAVLHCKNFLQLFVAAQLDQTLGQWGKKYEFSSRLLQANGDVVDLVSVNKNFCKGKERDSSGLFPISTPSGLVENELYVCD